MSVFGCFGKWHSGNSCDFHTWQLGRARFRPRSPQLYSREVQRHTERVEALEDRWRREQAIPYVIPIGDAQPDYVRDGDLSLPIFGFALLLGIQQPVS
jgi:hypothetical protein